MAFDKDHLMDIAEEHECLVADGFEDCILGLMYSFGSELTIAYDYDKVIAKLMKDGMDYEEAVEYWGFNIVGAYVGEKTPVYIETLEEEGKK